MLRVIHEGVIQPLKMVDLIMLCLTRWDVLYRITIHIYSLSESN